MTKLIHIVISIFMAFVILTAGCSSDAWTVVGEKVDVLYSHEYPLVSLNDGTKISGEISSGGALLCYISSGYIDEELIYRYYYKVENGGYKLGWVKAKWVTIFEDATVENARYVYRHCAKRKVYKNGNMGYGVEYYDCEFHVPPNSIIRKFDLDAE